MFHRKKSKMLIKQLFKVGSDQYGFEERMISRTKLYPATKRGVDCLDMWKARINSYSTAINKTV